MVNLAGGVVGVNSSKCTTVFAHNSTASTGIRAEFLRVGSGHPGETEMHPYTFVDMNSRRSAGNCHIAVRSRESPK